MEILSYILPVFTAIMGQGGTKEVHHHTIEYRDNPEMLKQMESLRTSIEQIQSDKNKSEAEKESLKASYESKISSIQTEMQKQREILMTQLSEYKAKTQVQADELKVIGEQLDEMKIHDIDDLARVNQKQFNRIIELCRGFPAIPIQGLNVGFFGSSGVGKSSIINTLYGSKICKTGRMETTRDIVPYHPLNAQLTYWDIPGQTDEINYVTSEFIGLIKRLDFLGIVVWRTPTEMSKTMRLLDHIGVSYYLVINKLDDMDDDERGEFKNQFEAKVKECNVHPTRLYYVSAKTPAIYDWQEFALVVGGVVSRVRQLSQGLSNKIKLNAPK
jgi:small GTP-binding protein